MLKKQSQANLGQVKSIQREENQSQSGGAGKLLR